VDIRLSEIYLKWAAERVGTVLERVVEIIQGSLEALPGMLLALARGKFQAGGQNSACFF